ncbi:MAG: hypothetical protein U9O94_06080 [Nanoarchaeota archaeon]|nr:hypothetical protein [Nanoarchaeota archaeon]
MGNSLVNLPDNGVDIETTDYITKEMLIGCLPDKRFRKAVTDDVVNLINSETESELRRVFRDNALSFSAVLMGGRYSLTAYINAIKFVSLKLMGDKHSTAYAKVFPDRYQNLVAKGTTTSQIACFADGYANNSLVIKILEQTIIPTHILNAGIYQDAINTQASLMMSAKSEMVRQKAAECLISNLAAPVASKIEIDVTHSNDVIDDLRATTRALAKQQRELIQGGHVNAKEIAHSDILKRAEPKVVDVEFTEEVEPEPVTKESFFDSIGK